MWNYNHNPYYPPEDIPIEHHGIKGMKWGVRRYQNKDGSLTPAGKKRQEKLDKKEAKKELNKLSKGLSRSGQAGTLATMASVTKFGSKDYDRLSQLMDSGRLVVQTKFKKNLAERSIDVYIGKEKTPTMRARLENGKDVTAEFVNKADQVRYNDFAKYYNKRRR